MNKPFINLRAQRGVGLTEVMIALVLGLALTAGIVSLFVQSKSVYSQDERTARMQENARYALELLASDLAMADFWGGVSFGGDFGNAGAITAGCAASDTTTAIRYFKPTSATDVPTDNTGFDCLTDGTGYAYKAETNALAIKHVSGKPTIAPSNGHVYIRTLGSAGDFVVSDGTATPGTPVGLQDWEYLVRVYYVATDTATSIPNLRRKYLSASNAMTDEGELVQGIEFFHLQFGVDSGSDGIANQYLSNPTDTQIQSAVSVRIYVLVRSTEQDFSYTDNKTYTLGDISLTPGGHYYRRLYTTTVQLRNPQFQLLLNAAAPS
ncbi:MAG: pilin-like protein [Proteobacteria bacterium]|nr:pilin-like protein [Pseudomonadota bacterium]